MTGSPYMTTAEVAEFLGVSKIKLTQDRARNLGISYVRLGRSIRYERATVEAYLKEHTVHATPKAP